MLEILALAAMVAAVVGGLVARWTAQFHRPAAPKHTVLEAEAFVLTDASGKRRGALFMAEGSPSLCLLDPDQKLTVDLSVTKAGGAKLSLTDKTGKERVLLASGDDDAVLTINDREGEMRAALGAFADGTCHLGLQGPRRQGGFHFGVSGTGTTTACARAADQKTRISLGVDSDGRAAFQLHDEEGRPRVVLTIYEGRPAVQIGGPNGKVRAMLSMTQDGPALALANENGDDLIVLRTDGLGSWLHIYDGDGGPRVSLGLDADGLWPALRLSGRDESEELSPSSQASAATDSGAEEAKRLVQQFVESGAAQRLLKGSSHALLSVVAGLPILQLLDSQGRQENVWTIPRSEV